MSHNDVRLRAGIFSVTIYFAACAFFLGFVPSAFGQSDPIPNEIRGLKMGDTSAMVVEKISHSGSYKDEPNDNRGRPKLTWTLQQSPHYKDVTFQFTEKDRLFLIRFNLKEAEKDEIQGLKKSFFDTQKFLWENPLKLKVNENDILLYIKETGPECFLDFSNRKSGQRTFELFNRAISAEDRPAKSPEQKDGSKIGGEHPANGDESKTQEVNPSEPEKAPASGDKPGAVNVEKPPTKKNE